MTPPFLDGVPLELLETLYARAEPVPEPLEYQHERPVGGGGALAYGRPGASFLGAASTSPAVLEALRTPADLAPVNAAADSAALELERLADDGAAQPPAYKVSTMSHLDYLLRSGIATHLAATPPHDPIRVVDDPGDPGEVLTMLDDTHAGWRPSSGGSGEPMRRIADEAVGALHVVRVTPDVDKHVVIARPPEDAARIPLGVTLTTAAAGVEVLVVDSGEVSDPGWNWTVGKTVLLGPDGTLTQSAPAMPAYTYVVALGIAVSATTLAVRISPSITLLGAP